MLLFWEMERNLAESLMRANKDNCQVSAEKGSSTQRANKLKPNKVQLDIAGATSLEGTGQTVHRRSGLALLRGWNHKFPLSCGITGVICVILDRSVSCPRHGQGHLLSEQASSMIVDRLGESLGRGTNRMIVESSDFILVQFSSRVSDVCCSGKDLHSDIFVLCRWGLHSSWCSERKWENAPRRDSSNQSDSTHPICCGRLTASCMLGQSDSVGKSHYFLLI